MSENARTISVRYLRNIVFICCHIKLFISAKINVYGDLHFSFGGNFDETILSLTREACEKVHFY